MTDFRAYRLADMDAKFKQTMDAAGRKFKNLGAGEFDGVVKIQSMNTKNFFYPEVIKKQKIVLHNTAGLITGSLFQLTQDNNHVSTPYLLARDGTIYQLFDDKYWAYHLGNNTSMPNSHWSPRSIGIEVDNIGPLKESATDPNILVDIYGKAYCTKADTQYYKAVNYRDFKYYATFTEAQYKALNTLVSGLCAKHKIPFTKLPAGKENDYYAKAPDVGIVSHTTCRKDKYDIGPAFDWSKLTG